MNTQTQIFGSRYLLLVSLCAALPAMGCSSAPNLESAEIGPPGPVEDIGATPGGQKDIDQARAVIEAGGVPLPGMIAVEGLLSQHDLPIAGAPCDATLCARPAAAWAPSLETGKNELYLHLGMLSNRTVSRSARLPLDIVAVVDKSAAMAGDMAETNYAVASIVENLQPGDRFAEVLFDGSSTTHVEFGPVDDPARVKARIQSVRADGSSNMLAGLKRGYEIAAANQQAGRLSRVMLFTCGYPANYEGPEGFVELSQSYANRGVALSLFGVLLGFDSILWQYIGGLRGGNAYFLDDLDKIMRVFEQDFDFIVSPLAYDLGLKIALESGLSPARVYGIPGDKSGAPRLGLTVKTIFPSKSRGAIVLRLSGQAANELSMGRLELGYVDALDGATKQAVVELPPAPSTDMPSYQGLGVHKAVVLVNEATSLIDICDKYLKGQHGEARAAAKALRDYLASEAAALDDDGLRSELKLVEKLSANLSA